MNEILELLKKIERQTKTISIIMYVYVVLSVITILLIAALG